MWNNLKYNCTQNIWSQSKNESKPEMKPYYGIVDIVDPSLEKVPYRVTHVNHDTQYKLY